MFLVKFNVAVKEYKVTVDTTFARQPANWKCLLLSWHQLT